MAADRMYWQQQYVPEGWISLRQLAEELGITYAKVNSWKHMGKLRTTRYGSYQYVPKEVVNEIRNNPSKFPLRDDRSGPKRNLCAKCGAEAATHNTAGGDHQALVQAAEKGAAPEGSAVLHDSAWGGWTPDTAQL